MQSQHAGSREPLLTGDERPMTGISRGRAELGKYLRVITLEDGETVHNAFPDRDFEGPASISITPAGLPI